MYCGHFRVTIFNQIILYENEIVKSLETSMFELGFLAKISTYMSISSFCYN